MQRARLARLVRVGLLSSCSRLRSCPSVRNHTDVVWRRALLPCVPLALLTLAIRKVICGRALIACPEPGMLLRAGLHLFRCCLASALVLL